jgi:anaerobic magnesium-protoporphyrin IX monomethyl ester cyclase
VQFRDDTFTIDPAWVRGICSEITRRGLRLAWDCYSTVGLVRDDLMREMQAAGCTCLSIGIESGNDEMLQKYKGTSKAEVREKMALLRRIGMQMRLFFMLAPPAECRQHLDETLAFALELDPDFAMFTPTVPLPGATLYEELLANGCGVPDYDHHLQNFQSILYAPPPFTIAELEEFRSECYRRFYFRPKYLCRFAANLLNWDSIRRGWEALGQLPAIFRRAW